MTAIRPETSRADRSARALALTLAMLLLVFSGPRSVPAQARTQLRVLIASGTFSTVNRADALVAMRVWMEAVGKRMNIDISVEVDSYDSVADLRRVLKEGGADLVIAETLDYLEIEPEKLPFDPSFVASKGDRSVNEHLLLARRDRVTDLKTLRGRRFIFHNTNRTNLGRLWLDHELRGRGLGGIDAFSGSSAVVIKSSGAILPVFFGQADACVVDADSYEVTCEMNPQIGRDLAVLARSAPMPGAVICVSRRYSDHREELMRALAGIQDDPAGRQILTVFRTSGLRAFSDEDLRGVRGLRTSFRADTRMAER